MASGMKKIFLVAFAISGLFALGCTSHDFTAIKGPDGQEWVAISCKDSVQGCWKVAGDFCPTGYDTADEVQTKGHGFLFFGHHVRNEMLIRCKSPTMEKVVAKAD
jgi:hypothetical protein